MLKMWVNIIACVYLGICAVFDYIKKEIPLFVVWLGIITAIILRAAGFLGGTTWWGLGMSLLPGIFFWILGFVTREQVGYGDGWLLLMIGLFVGYENCFVVLLIGLVTESSVALLLLVFRKIHRDEEVPFAPFLLLGMVMLSWP